MCNEKMIEQLLFAHLDNFVCNIWIFLARTLQNRGLRRTLPYISLLWRFVFLPNLYIA